MHAVALVEGNLADQCAIDDGGDGCSVVMPALWLAPDPGARAGGFVFHGFSLKVRSA